MIPQAAIHSWRSMAPWAMDVQVEQDLVLSRILVEMFQDEALAEQLAFRGGTALHKLFLAPAARYSEDIDLGRFLRCYYHLNGSLFSGRTGSIFDDRNHPYCFPAIGTAAQFDVIVAGYEDT